MRISTPLLLSLAVVVAANACTKPVVPAKSSELAQKLGTNHQAITTGFAAGSLVIPMDVLQDVTANSHAIKAYGLVTELALNNVTVNWAISSTKAVDGADITGFAGFDVTKTTTTYANQSLYGGPFVIDASEAAAAMTVISAWNSPTQQAVVLEATASFTANIQEQIVAAPLIAIDDDGYEYFAFNYLNGAGITDSQGNSWPTAQSSNPPYSSPDTQTPAQIGAGSLLNADGTPAYTNLTSMHYVGTIADSTVLAVQNWLKSTALNMAVMECLAITAFENDTNGHFLTTAGFTVSTTKPGSGTVILPDSPFNQLYITGGTTLSTTTGAEAAMNLAGGSAWQSGVQILAAGTAPATNVLWASGPAYGNVNYGSVTYLAGHDYQGGNSTPPLPISTNNLTNGVRMYLNAFLQTAAIQAQYQPVITTTMTSTFPNAAGVVVYTINYAVGGAFGIANAATLTDVLPTGMSYTSSTGGGVNSGGTVTWSLGNLVSGASGSVTVTGTATSGSTFSNSATLGWKIGRTSKSQTTNIVQNVFPITTITSGPANPTAATSATFTFTSNVSGATFMCKLDAGAYAACTSPATLTGLSVASHTLKVESVVPSGNTELVPPSYTWVVEAAPVVTIVPGTGASTYSNSTSATFTFTPSKPISTYTCSLNGGAFATCTTPTTFTGLTTGTQTLLVNATDTTGLATLTPASYSWMVNTVAPTVTIATGPAALTNATTASFTYTSTETPVTYLCKLSPAATFTSSSACTNATFTGLSAGAHTLQIEATDQYGNTSAASNTWSWTVELTPPTISITAHPSVLSNSATANFTLVGAATAPATVSSYICSLDGAGYAACTSTPSYSGLTNAQHTLLANVIDTAGNEATSPASFTWTINTVAPTATIVSGPSTPTDATTANFTFSATETPVSYLCKLSPATTFTSCTDPQTYSGLSNGSYTLTIEAVDAFGNTSAASTPWPWTVATTPPTVTIPTGPALLTNSTSAAFTISAVDTQPISTYLCALDSATFTTCSAAPTFAGPLSAGQHILQANVIDAAGNSAVKAAVYVWTIGTTNPTVSIDTKPPNPTDLTTAVFVFSSNESPVTYQCKLSPATTFGACPTDDTYNGLTSGTTYTLTVEATDVYGNTSTTPATWTWLVDTAAPVVTITSGPALETDQTTATFVLHATDTLPISTYLCSLDGAPFTDCTTPVTYNSLTNKTHTFLANAQDTAGNIATAPASYTWTVSTTLPTVMIVSGPPSPTDQTTATFVFSSDESPVTYLCELAPATTYTACPADYTSLANGPYTLKVEAMDQYGNISLPATWNWTVDTTLPTIKITSGPALLTNQTSATFAFVATDTIAISSYLCALDGPPFTTCSSPKTYPTVSPGAHVFEVTAIDAAGNQAAPPASYSWTISTTLPTVTIVSGPPSVTNQTTATFVYSSSESPVTYLCELSPATTYTACPTNFPNLANGPYTLNVEAVDQYGNTSTPATWTWTVDTTLPLITITSGPALLTNQTTAAFVVVASDTLAITSYLCSLNGGPYTTCSTTPSYPVVPLGTNVFTVTAIDAAGNQAAPPASYTWTVSTTLPTVTIVSGPPTVTNQTTATFVYSSSESPVTYLCELSPATTYTTCPANFPNLANGPYTLNVEAVDQYGNTSTPATWTWTVDTTLPTVQITSGPALLTNQNTAAFVVVAADTLPITSYLCSLDGVAYTTCSTTPSYSMLADGTHVFHVTVIDSAGNQAAPPASYTWTIDTQTPTFTITGQPSNPTDQTTATFTFSSPEMLTYQCELAPATTFTPCPVTFTNLPPGTQTVTIEGTDPYGNVTAPQTVTWNIDTTLPAVTITSGPAQQTNITSAAFVVVAMDTLAIVSYECSLDGSAFTVCSSTPSYPTVSVGSHVFEATAIDAAGNVGAPPAVWSWTVNNVAPTFTIVSGPPMQTSDTTATFVFNSPDPGVTYLCELAPATTYTACPPDFTNLPNGPQTLMVEAQDPYGNVSAPQTYTWTVDTTPPTIQILTGPPLFSNSGTASFTLFAMDTVAISTYLCALDGAAFSNCTSTPTFGSITPLTDGQHTLLASATDVLGNTAVTPASYTWSINTQPPTTTIVSGPPPQTNSMTATFMFSSDESPVTYLCELNSVPPASPPVTTFTPCPVPPVFNMLSDGSYTLTVAAEDEYGNIDPNPPTYTWMVVTTLPVVTITQHPPLLTNSKTGNFTLTSSVVVNFLCSLDGSAFAACTMTPSYTMLADGSHTFLAGGTDAAGNMANPPATYTWTIDTQPPTTQIVTKPPLVTNSTTGSFTFSSSADPASYLCELSPATTFTPCPIPAVFTGLMNGMYTLTVASEDEYGNVDPNPPSYTWTVNTTAPVVTITSGPASMSTSTTAAFTLASTETLTTYLCALDGANYTMCSSTPSYAGLTTGAHSLNASGLDAAGNMAVPASYSWTVLPALPNTTILTMPTNPTTDATAVFTFGSNASPVTFQCELDGAASFTACPVPSVFPGLMDGTHTLVVRAKDSFGQVDPNPPSYTWVVDTTPPDTTIVTQPPAITNLTTANFTFSSDKSPVTYECQLDNSGTFAACATPDALTGLTNGQHVLQVRAVDSAGLKDATPAVASWIVNTIGPTTIILTGPEKTTTTTTATFTFTANEDPVTYECSVDSTSEWTACTSPTTLATVALGAHTFHVRATDDAGNVDPNPPSYPWTVEAPAVTPTPENLQFRGARLGCSSSTTGMWAMIGLLPLLLMRRRRLARVRAQ